MSILILPSESQECALLALLYRHGLRRSVYHEIPRVDNIGDMRLTHLTLEQEYYFSSGESCRCRCVNFGSSTSQKDFRGMEMEARSYHEALQAALPAIGVSSVYSSPRPDIQTDFGALPDRQTGMPRFVVAAAGPVCSEVLPVDCISCQRPKYYAAISGATAG